MEVKVAWESGKTKDFTETAAPVTEKWTRPYLTFFSSAFRNFILLQSVKHLR
ncbi:hypothetical protein Closa_2220 [[Clostridium] saccharolyticum WM1]|uniref:Uncharacterized protein n=1 Tax=Lacrimispora saccharolytica (strain ATCC 35040 / DSM 2544 / NRCC 2533 / WM1) TaxID=610130 RepID=D9R2E8_LACSW|nr:hypothetical protein Closa_2220 [[Clostridium] saccharolyticum WM1]